MDESEGYLGIALCGDIIYIRATGLASMNNGMSLLELTTALLDQGYNDVVVDLEGCTGMDSTFLGVIAAIATHGPDQKGPNVTIINAGKECLSSMDYVGLTKFVKIHPEKIEAPDIETYKLEDERISDTERVRFIREAHERLLLIDKRNRELFGPLLRMLSDELAKKEKESKGDEEKGEKEQ